MSTVLELMFAIVLEAIITGQTSTLSLDIGRLSAQTRAAATVPGDEEVTHGSPRGQGVQARSSSSSR